MTLTEKEAPAAEPPLGPDPTPGGNPARVVQLLFAVALITAVFIALGWGDLLLFIAILVVIVMLHELGHFVTAKRAGMKVTEYFVGFGPRLWSMRRGETEYGVKAIPAGGYVRITGFTSTEDVTPEDEPRAYRQQPFHQRIIVASAGSAMHFLIAFVLAWSAIMYFGTPSTTGVAVAGFVQFPGHAQNPAQAAHLRVGDTIVAVNGHSVSSADQLTSVIRRSAGKPLQLEVVRGGRDLKLTVVPVVGHSTANGSEALGSGTGSSHGIIGIQQGLAFTSEGPVRAVGTAAGKRCKIRPVISQGARSVSRAGA